MTGHTRHSLRKGNVSRAVKRIPRYIRFKTLTKSKRSMTSNIKATAGLQLCGTLGVKLSTPMICRQRTRWSIHGEFWISNQRHKSTQASMTASKQASQFIPGRRDNTLNISIQWITILKTFHMVMLACCHACCLECAEQRFLSKESQWVYRACWGRFLLNRIVHIHLYLFHDLYLSDLAHCPRELATSSTCIATKKCSW